MQLSPEQAAFNQSQAQARSDAVAAAIRDATPEAGALTALDYGCGSGPIGLRLANHFQHVTLADVYPDVVAGAIEAARDASNVDVRLLDLSTKDGVPEDLCVDVVLSCLSWHHVRDLDVLLEALPLVAPGGRLFVADMDFDGGAYHADLPDFDGVQGFDRDDLRQRLERHGYGDVRVSDLWRSQKWITGKLTDLSLFMMQARIPPGAAGTD
ncbi:MAG: class I SAM-dependent methyltransferase [Propionibacteriaceae bacterium]|nr:class I SAM-dependent methyltransferase [Propionibacteriaceae bacterium]